MSYEKAFFHTDLREFFTPRVVLAWPNILEPRRMKGDETSALRYTVTGLIPKAYDTGVLMEEWARVGRDAHGKEWDKKKNPPIFKTEDDEKLAQCADEYPRAIKGVTYPPGKPEIYGPTLKRWIGEAATDIYSGRKALLGGRFFAYKTGRGGISFGLNKVVLLEHGERLSLAGGSRPISADGAGFEPIDIGETESASELFA